MTTNQKENTLEQTKTEHSSTWLNSAITQLGKLIGEATKNVLACGKLVCEIMDTAGIDADEIAERAGVPKSFVAGLERVGRRKLHPSLMFPETPGQRALRGLSYELQAKYLKEPLHVLVTDDGKVTEMLVACENLTPIQADMVIESRRVRSLAEQRSWMEAKKMKAEIKEVSADEPVRVVRGKLVVLKQCTLSTADLLRYLTKMQSE